jgi:hypothetical protein
METTHPGRGETAQALVAAVGGDDINLVQQAYYNGHYGFCGAKVQHVLQADGLCYSFTCPLSWHDASVLCSSSMITMLSVLYVNNDHACPVKTVTNKAYGQTRHFCPLHMALELRMMNWQEKATAEEEDQKNKGPCMAVELSFNNIVRKFTHSDYFASHRILQQGSANWPYLQTLLDLQVLFCNCKVLSGNIGHWHRWHSASSNNLDNIFYIARINSNKTPVMLTPLFKTPCMAIGEKSKRASNC